MYTSFLINIDIIKALGIIGSVIAATWFIGIVYSRIRERLRYLEKITDELRVDLKELTKYVYGNNTGNS